MLDIVFNEVHPKIVSDVKFSKEFDYMCSRKFPYGHKELAEVIKRDKLGVASVIIIVERLDHELYDDPKHCIKTNSLWVSKVRQEARKELMNRYYSQEELARLKEKYGLLDWKTNDPNYVKKGEEREFKFIVEDALFEAQEEMLIPKMVEQLTNHTGYVLDEEGYPVEDENGDCIPLEDEELKKKQYEAELERIMMPEVYTKHERQALMPKPFDYWDWRNGFQQYFFIEDEEKIYWDRGGSGSSGAREHQGRFAHTFATLSRDHEIEAKTYFFRYDKHNQMVFLGSSDKFKAMNRELSGNYQSEWSEVKELFKGRCVRITDHTGIEDVQEDGDVW